MRRVPAILLLAPVFVSLGSCVAPSRPAPEPPRPIPVPVPAPMPSPTPTPAAPLKPSGNWTEWEMAPGSWAYREEPRGSTASFGVGGRDPDLTLSCDSQRGRLYLARRGSPGGAVPLTVRTTSTLRGLQAVPAADARPYIVVEFAPRDPLLDAIAFSRGRFAVEAGGLPAIVAPPWPELSRVIEDCR